ncbi:YfbU family protein [Glutamicibacter arilaitensis]|uniref:YfbU family protein n=1 Tax=Glutamicibacter arilaitensis TaxID=256701 RepID=UPI003FD03BE4
MASITVRVTEEMHTRVGAAAEERGMKASAYVREMIEEKFRLDGVEILEERPSVDLDLTPVERKMLVMMSRILLSTEGDLDDAYYVKDQEVQAIQALENGFISEYSDKAFGGIYDPMPLSDGELVWDILDMFRVIMFSIQELEGTGWPHLKLQGGKRIGTFQGFDANDEIESKMWSYVRYLVKSDKWAEQRDFVLGDQWEQGDSHSPMLPTYRKMLRVFKPRWAAVVRGSERYLPVDDLTAVLIAGGARPLAHGLTLATEIYSPQLAADSQESLIINLRAALRRATTEERCELQERLENDGRVAQSSEGDEESGRAPYDHWDSHTLEDEVGQLTLDDIQHLLKDPQAGVI